MLTPKSLFLSLLKACTSVIGHTLDLDWIIFASFVLFIKHFEELKAATVISLVERMAGMAHFVK